MGQVVRDALTKQENLTGQLGMDPQAEVNVSTHGCWRGHHSAYDHVAMRPNKVCSINASCIFLPYSLEVIIMNNYVFIEFVTSSTFYEHLLQKFGRCGVTLTIGVSNQEKSKSVELSLSAVGYLEQFLTHLSGNCP